MEPVRAVVDPLTWLRLLDEAGVICQREKAFFHRSRVIVNVVSVEVELLSEFHVQSVDRDKLRALVGRLLQGNVPCRVVARERSELLDPQAVAALAAFGRRRPKAVRLEPMKILRIVTRDDFRCRICGTEVEAHPRSVVRVEGEGTEDELITVCDACRLDLLRSQSEDDPGPS